MTTAAETKRVPIPSRGVDYRGKVVLAPMVRSGELPSRLVALQYGADLVWGPETVDRAIIGTTRRFNHTANTVDWTRKPSNGHGAPAKGGGIQESIIYRVHPEREAGRHIFQIGTSNPETAVQAARLVAADVSGIDVNAGCPKHFSIHDGMGAALLRTPDKLVAILEALVKEIVPEFNIGISVKIRILDTAADTEALVRRLVATGITGLTVHCRTTPMRPRERAIRGQLSMVADICHQAGVACLMNGDVESRDHASKLVPEFGVDGAMIAVAAENNFSVFRSGAEGGPAPWDEVVERYVRASLEVENKFSNTKFLLCQIIPGKQAAYRAANQSKSFTSLCQVLGLDHLSDRAREVDIARGLDPDGSNANTIKSNNNNKNNNTNNKQKHQKKKGGDSNPNRTNDSALAAGGDTAKSRQQNKKMLSSRGVGSNEKDTRDTPTEGAPAVEPAPTAIPT